MMAERRTANIKRAEEKKRQKKEKEERQRRALESKKKKKEEKLEIKRMKEEERRKGMINFNNFLHLRMIISQQLKPDIKNSTIFYTKHDLILN